MDEHIAELLGAQGNFNEAAALYQQVIARAPRPEVEQALGDLYLFMGKPDLAKAWHAKALAGYLESTRRGEVQYFHHLAGFYADAQENGPEAVKWAYKDLALRQNFGSYDALAWALYRTGLFSEALEAMRAGLSSGVQDAHIFFHAGMIYTSAGRASEGREFLVKAGQIDLTALHRVSRASIKVRNEPINRRRKWGLKKPPILFLRLFKNYLAFKIRRPIAI